MGKRWNRRRKGGGGELPPRYMEKEGDKASYFEKRENSLYAKYDDDPVDFFGLEGDVVERERSLFSGYEETTYWVHGATSEVPAKMLPVDVLWVLGENKVGYKLKIGVGMKRMVVWVPKSITDVFVRVTRDRRSWDAIEMSCYALVPQWFAWEEAILQR